MKTCFELSPATLEAVSELKPAFGVHSEAAVIRKALALARVAADNAERVEGQWCLRLVKPDSTRVLVVLSG